MKVLIIDDDEAMISIWSTVLKKDSIEVLTAGSGKLGLELAQKNVPDFILLDQIITDMKGNDVLKQLKSNPATANIPVALVSNYSEPEMMHEAIESGAVDYILKYQIDPSDLANKIKTLLHGTKPLNPASPDASQGGPADPSAPFGSAQGGSSGQVPSVTAPAPTDPTTQASAPVAPQPQIIQPPAPVMPQPQIIDPTAQQSAPAAPDPTQPVSPQPVVIDPTKPTQ